MRTAACGTMTPLLSPIPREFDELVLCYYLNQTTRVQVIRIANIDQWLFERTIAPQEGLFFRIPPHAQLEVQWHDVGGIKLLDLITCHNLRVNESHCAEPKSGELPDPADWRSLAAIW